MREKHLCWHLQEEFKSYSSEMMGVRIQEKKQKQEMWLLMNLTVHILIKPENAIFKKSPGTYIEFLNLNLKYKLFLFLFLSW